MKKTQQKVKNTFYSPEYLVKYILKKTVGVWFLELENKLLGIYSQKNDLYWNHFVKEIKSLSVLDPACGEGVFLLNIYHFLENFYGQIPSQYVDFQIERQITENIFGLDIDQKALDRLQETLFAKSGFYCPNIRCANFLISDSKNEFSGKKFDIVLGNPPSDGKFSQEEEQYFINKFQVESFDHALLFMLKSRNLLKDKGLNAFLIPKSFTNSSDWKKIKQEILPNLTEIVDCGKVWKEVNLEMSICISQKNTATATYLSSLRENLFFVEISQINKDLANKFAFILNGVKKEEIAIALKINGLEKRLNELIDSQKGANLQALVHAKGDKYVLGWKNIDRYQFASNLQSKVKTSLVHDTKALVKNNAILVQNMISFINAPKAGVQISACLALKQDFFVLDSINQLKNKSDYDTKFVLAIINSKLVSWYIYHFILAHDKKVVYFDLSIIEKIPFPNLDLNDPNDKNKYDSMIEKVENLSKWYKQKNKFAAEISRTEPELDKLVFDLYGLNEEEIKFLK